MADLLAFEKRRSVNRVNHLSFHRPSAPVLALLGLLFWACPTKAERVLITNLRGELGHGWLFAATGRDAGACWVATASHVIENPATKEPDRFHFSDAQGLPGQVDAASSVREFPAALRATSGEGDLAFGRVTAGRSSQPCLSRLGLNSLAYRLTLERDVELRVASLLTTSRGFFPVEAVRAGTDAVGGGMIALRPENDRDAEDYLKKGLSGSTATFERDGVIQPFAMILKVDPEKGVARALRFDLIREAFAAFQAVNVQAERDERGFPYKIVSFDGLPASPSERVQDLLASDGCWRALPRGGSRVVSVTLAIRDEEYVTKGATISAGGDCSGGPTTYRVDTRASDNAPWQNVRTCPITSAIGPSPQCAFRLEGPRQLRFQTSSRTEIAWRALRIY